MMPYYFDHAASTPVREDVMRVMMEVMVKHYANPSSLHQLGVAAHRLLERARTTIAEQFALTEPHQWVFTSGGTESNNMALYGVARHYRQRGNHIITIKTEHASIIEPLRQLEREGFSVTYVPVDRFGRVSPEQIREAITDKTIMVSIQYVNNETGVVQPIADIGTLLRAYPHIYFHVDGVQSVGKLPIQLVPWGVDLFSISAHKFGGPRGVGLLYVRSGVQLSPLMSGGGQQQQLRPGTENVAAIVAMVRALRLAIQEQPQRYASMVQLREQLLAKITTLPELIRSGYEHCQLADGTNIQAPHIVHVTFPGMKPEVVLHMLEQRGVIASTQSACSSKSGKPSRVLEAMGMSAAQAMSGLRFSLGDEHDSAAIQFLYQQLSEVVEHVRPLMRKEPVRHGR